MCGVPYHAADGYIARLVRKGFRVAICEQVEDPRKAKGLVKREVVRVVSPGTLTDGTYLEAREPLVPDGHRAGRGASTRTRPAALDVVGAALVDLSTGEFRATEYRGASGPAGAGRRDRGPAAARDRGAARLPGGRDAARDRRARCR